MVSGYRHLIGEKNMVANIGKSPYNVSVTQVHGNLGSRIQVRGIRI